MSVIFKKDKPINTEKLEQDIKGLKQEAERLSVAEQETNQLLAVAFTSAIISDRASNTNYITDDVILSAVSYITYPDWEKEKEYIKGEILKDPEGGLYYEVVENHKSNETYPIATTFAYYRLIELSHSGTLKDPIPYPEQEGIVVNVVSGLYYSYKGSIYKAAADMPHCVYPPDTEGMWQWELQPKTKAKASKATKSTK